MTVNAINGSLLSSVSAIDGIARSTISAINGIAAAAGGGGGTRLYLGGNTTVPATPAFTASWHKTSSATRRKMTTTLDANSSYEVSVTVQAGTSPEFMLCVQHISAPLAAQTISGNVIGQLAGRQTTSAPSATVAVLIKVMSGDGSTLRGTLLAIAASQQATEPPVLGVSATIYNNRQLKDSSDNTVLTLSSVVVQAGDLLVVETGFRDIGGSGAGVLRFRDNNTLADLPQNETATYNATTLLNPWIELSHTLTFQ